MTASIKATPEQITEWYTRWKRPVKTWLRNRRSIPSIWVDDLAQEVFIRLLAYSDRLLVDNPQCYIFKVAANVANSWREHSSVRRPHDNIDDLEITSENVDPEVIMTEASDDILLTRAIRRLSDRQQRIIELHTHGDQTYTQIAKTLGLSYRIVLRELTLAYTMLRIMLDNKNLIEMYHTSLPTDRLRWMAKKVHEDIRYGRTPDDHPDTAPYRPKPKSIKRKRREKTRPSQEIMETLFEQYGGDFTKIAQHLAVPKKTVEQWYIDATL